MHVYHCSVTITGDFSPVMGLHVIAANPSEAKAYTLNRFVNYPVDGLPESTEKHIRRAKYNASVYGVSIKATKSTVDAKNADNA